MRKSWSLGLRRDKGGVAEARWVVMSCRYDMDQDVESACERREILSCQMLSEESPPKIVTYAFGLQLRLCPWTPIMPHEGVVSVGDKISVSCTT